MDKLDTWLLSREHSVYSQLGEDGILEAIFEVIGEGDRFCCEFGAWDGKHLSNTYHLIHDRAWSGVLIEGNEQRFPDLLQTVRENPQSRLTPLRALVGWSGDEALDKLLGRTEIPRDFSLLSIDIDGNDYHVWEALGDYAPRVVVIEFNPTIPVDIHFVQERDPNVNQSSSLLALCELGKRKGYELVATTEWNAFFVRSELFPRFEIRDNRPEVLWPVKKYLTRVYQLFDGTLVLDGCDRLLWHDVQLDVANLSHVPKPFRMFVNSMSQKTTAEFYAWKDAQNAPPPSPFGAAPPPNDEPPSRPEASRHAPWRNLLAFGLRHLASRLDGPRG